MRNAFAPIVRARPCPIFGRPVRLRGRPHRLQPDTSPHALRIPDRSGHPALRDIPSSWLKVCLGCVRLSPSCPFRLLHTRLLSRPARRYPRFRIRPSSSERRGDFNPHDSRAAQRTLRTSPPPQSARPVPRGRPVGPVISDLTTLWGFPCCARFPCVRAAASTPVQRLGVVFAHLTQPYQPSPKLRSGRPAHRPFRGLLGVHSRCGPHTCAVTYM